MVPLEEGRYYHIYNRGINSCDLFLYDDDFLFFLRNYFYYLYPTVETFAYCLMKNHFHFLIRVRTIEEQKQFFESFSLNSSTEGPIWLPHGYNNEKFKVQTPSRQFSHLFNKYSRNFNKWANRTGKLFEQPFKRKVITDESYLIHLICYIHRNPIHHKITDTFEAYPYSSFKTFLSGTPTFLGVKKVLNWFQGKKGFIAAHKEMKLKITPEMTLE